MKIDISKYKDITLSNYAYCENCGAKLIIKKVFLHYYNTATGEPNMKLKWGCPNSSWIDFIFRREHCSFSTNEKGERW